MQFSHMPCVSHMSPVSHMPPAQQYQASTSQLLVECNTESYMITETGANSMQPGSVASAVTAKSLAYTAAAGPELQGAVH